MEKIVLEFLNKNEVLFNLHSHPAVHKVEESEKIIGNSIPGLRTKSLFLKSDKQYFLVTLEGKKRLDIKNLKKELKVKDLSFASIDELFKELKVKPGSVSLLCMLNSSDSVTLILDEKVYDSEISVFHPNANTESLEVDRTNLLKILKNLNCKIKILKL